MLQGDPIENKGVTGGTPISVEGTRIHYGSIPPLSKNFYKKFQLFVTCEQQLVLVRYEQTN